MLLRLRQVLTWAMLAPLELAVVAVPVPVPAAVLGPILLVCAVRFSCVRGNLWREIGEGDVEADKGEGSEAASVGAEVE